MKFATIIWTIVLLLPACDTKTAKDYLIEADKLSEQGKYQEAIKLLDKAISIDQRYLGAYINRAADKSALGDYIAAIEDYQAVLQIDSKNTLALFNIGNNHKRLGTFKTAIEFYNQAFDTKGGQSLYVNYTQNDFADFSDFDVPGYAIHYERGIAYYNIDSLKRAFDDFNVAIKQNFMTAESYCWLGYIYVSTGQTNLACETFRISLQLGNKDADEELSNYCNKQNEKHGYTD